MQSLDGPKDWKVLGCHFDARQTMWASWTEGSLLRVWWNQRARLVDWVPSTHGESHTIAPPKRLWHRRTVYGVKSEALQPAGKAAETSKSCSVCWYEATCVTERASVPQSVCYVLGCRLCAQRVERNLSQSVCTSTLLRGVRGDRRSFVACTRQEVLRRLRRPKMSSSVVMQV